VVENIAPEYPPAEEPPPENAFDISSWMNQLLDTLEDRGVLRLTRAEETGAAAGLQVALGISGIPGISLDQARFMAWLIDHLPKLARDILQAVAGMSTPLLKTLVEVVSGLLQPGMQVLGDLTGAYVRQVAGTGLEKSAAGLPVPGGPAKDATSVVFDQIMAPLLGLLTPSSPGRVGAGETNAQHILGTIISLHLSTWMVNIISNLTGLGALKWINSFDDAITSGISARGFSRMATRPYLETFVVQPAKKDLNRRYPLELGSVSGLLTRYARGYMTADEVKFALRGKGFDDETVADLLLESLKLFSVDDLVYLLDLQVYSFDDAVDALKLQGYPENVAKTKLQKPYFDRVDAQYRSLASALVNAAINRQIDTAQLRSFLKTARFDEDEIQAMVVRAATLQEVPTRLSLAQVRELYNEGVEDLAFVEGFLHDEGYSPDDVDRLILLYFTKKEERDARRAAQADAARNRAEAQAKADKAALAAQETERLLLG
jgi:hypothetical protein